MQLHYLEFDFSDEDSGRGSFDAMASVLADRVPALLAEIAAVLRWAQDAFGPAGALGDESEWDVDLQGVIEPGTPLVVHGDAARGALALTPEVPDAARVTLTVTLGGSPAFCGAFRERFGIGA